jgi:hypothetical protein
MTDTYLMNYLAKWLLLFGALLSAPEPVLASSNGSLPPIGQRIYILKTDGGKRPVAILRDQKRPPGAPESGVKVLRDPLSTVGSHPQKKAAGSSALQMKGPEVREKAGSLRFKKVIVSGAISRPRIDFGQDPLPLERVDEAVEGEFFQKIFIPARDDRP